MKSRYDRPDIGETLDGCDGLEALDVPDGPVCYWCNDPISDPLNAHEPYCSATCAAYADMNSHVRD